MSNIARLTFAAACLAVALAAAGCGSQSQPAGGAGTKAEGPIVKVSEFDVEGMTCGHCERAIQTTVGMMDGVETVQASHTEKKAVVRYDAAKVKPEAIVAAIEKLGYTAKLRQGS
ncbi:MAG: copper ion binding protein [Acidobacteria bacterium]|jgi:copper chaperone|nr:copper ion binding protein [Acidobacteriota bacterium]MCU0253378.1 copper ion binding protein [Acidobacteriota bacterium]